MLKKVTGKHDIYFVFKGLKGSKLFNFDCCCRYNLINPNVAVQSFRKVMVKRFQQGSCGVSLRFHATAADTSFSKFYNASSRWDVAKRNLVNTLAVPS